MNTFFTVEEIKPSNLDYFTPNNTDEDNFYNYLDVFHDDDSFLDFYTEVISFDNIQIDSNKNVGDGSWIKLKTKTGYEVFYAKKVKVNEEFLNKLLKKKNSSKEKTDELKSQIVFLETCIYLNLKPYVVKVKRGGRFDYYLPYQYDLCGDVQTYVDCVISNVKGVEYKTYYKNQQDKDKIFYLQSRGISKENAIFLSKLTDTYFIVDLEILFSVYTQKFAINN